MAISLCAIAQRKACMQSALVFADLDIFSIAPAESLYKCNQQGRKEFVCRNRPPRPRMTYYYCNHVMFVFFAHDVLVMTYGVLFCFFVLFLQKMN